MDIHPFTHILELRWDLDKSTAKLVETNNSHNPSVRERECVDIYILCLVLLPY